jgi:hypothetical protein
MAYGLSFHKIKQNFLEKTGKVIENVPRICFLTVLYNSKANSRLNLNNMKAECSEHSRIGGTTQQSNDAV